MGDSKMMDLSQVVLDDFASRVGSQFRCEQPMQCQFELTEASIFNSGQAHDDRRQPFSLLFKTANEFEPLQGIYHLYHAELGQLELFLVPVGESDGHVLYEATFN